MNSQYPHHVLLKGFKKGLLHGRGHRQTNSEITLFKSVGYALEDLIAAQVLLQAV